MKKTITQSLMTFAILTSGVCQAGAAEAISIEDLIGAALQNNPEIRWYEAAIAEGRANLTAAGQWENPQVSMSAGINHATSGGITSNGHIMAAGLSQKIEFPQRIQLRKAIANGDMRLGEIGLENFRVTIGNRIRESVFGFQSSELQEQAAAESASRTADLLEGLAQRDPAGVAPLLQRRVLESQLLRLQQDILQHRKEATGHRLEVEYLTGLSSEKVTQIQPLSPNFPEIPGDEILIEMAQRQNFEVLYQVEEIAQQGYRVKLAQHERWPEVSLQPFATRQTGGGPQNMVGLGFSLPLPLWNRNEGAIEGAKAKEAQLQASLASTLRRVQRDLTQQSQGYRAVRAQMQSWSSGALEEFKKAAEMADRHFRLGAIDITTYLELQSRNTEAITELLMLRAEAYQHLLEIELLAGQSMNLSIQP